MGSVYFTYNIDPNLYYDIEGLDGTIQINLPLAISNAEDYALWFKVELISPPADYTLYSQQLGTLDSGNSGFFVFNIQRNLPTLTSGELGEELTFRVTAYTDFEYSIIYGYKESVSTINFFDSYDPAWTLDSHDTFDDGLKHDWGCAGGNVVADGNFPCTYEWYSYTAISDAHFLSAPYSFYNAYGYQHYGGYAPSISKTFTVSSCSKGRIVIHMWYDGGNFALKVGNTTYVTMAVGALLPTNKWLRLSFPISAGSQTVIISNDSNLYIDEVRIVIKA